MVWFDAFNATNVVLDGCEKFAGESKLSDAPRGRLAYSYFKKLQLVVNIFILIILTEMFLIPPYCMISAF